MSELATKEDLEAINKQLDAIYQAIQTNAERTAPEMLGMEEMCRRLGGVSWETCRKRIREMPGFPEPVTRRPLKWKRTEVDAYLEKV